MKKYFLILVCLVATICSNAQTTGSLYPQNKSVYVPETYNNIMEVSYDNLIDASKAKVVLSVGNESEDIMPSNITEYGFNLDILATLQKMGKANDNTVFTVKVSNVLPADTIINVDPDFEGEIETPTQNTYVEDVEGIYLLRSSFPTANANPANGTTLDSDRATINVTFSEAVKVADILFMSGSRMDQKVSSYEGPTSAVTNLTANILPEYWSTSISPASMQVRLASVTISSNEQDWNLPDYTFAYSYNFPQNTAKFETYYPLNDETTVWDVYADGWGFMDLIFDGEVDFGEEGYAELTYVVKDVFNPIVIEVEPWDCWGSWNPRNNKYYFEIPMMPIDNVTEDNLISITVRVYDLVSNGQKVKVDTIEYNNITLPNPIKGKKIGTANIDVCTMESSNITIYNIQGNAVLSNANSESIKSLIPGVYIVNGKKILVR